LIKSILFYCCAAVCLLSICLAQDTKISLPELQKEYTPQNSPEDTYRMELRLLSQGIYCNDLPIFDLPWRRKNSRIQRSEQYKHTANEFSTGYKTRKEGKYAVIYYPFNKALGPVFLYKESAGWIIDRTAVWEYIHYNTSNDGWFAYAGNYPYLPILKKIFNLERVVLDNGVSAYQVK